MKREYITPEMAAVRMRTRIGLLVGSDGWVPASQRNGTMDSGTPGNTPATDGEVVPGPSKDNLTDSFS